MEAFSLLKYWKGGGSFPGNGGGGGDPGFCTRATTINMANKVSETEDDADGGDDDDGPFFDLEFAVHEGEEAEEEKANGNCTDTEEENDEMESSGDGTTDDGEREFNLALSSASSSDRSDPNMALSPSDDLFFKGGLVPVESSSINVFDGSDINTKTQFPSSFLKSATKFRIFMLKFKKSKMSPPPAEKTSDPKQKQEEKEEESNKHGNKFLTVKYKVEEVPIVSLFTRENSKNGNKSQKQSSTAEEPAAASCVASNSISSSEEKRFSKDVMHKYLKKVKPLYIRASKRYGEKMRLSGQLSSLGSSTPKIAQSTSTQEASPPKSMATVAEKGQQEMGNVVETPSTSNGKGSQKQGNLQTGLRVVCKHLGKSRSASLAVAPVGSVQSRRDDSLLQQQDGIQSAILHCKRSFNASRESESNLLSRSASNSSYEKSATEHSRKSSDQEVSSLGGVNSQPNTPFSREN